MQDCNYCIFGGFGRPEEQNRARFQVAYVGDDDNDHSMDVDTLAPALLAFGRLIRAANEELNHDYARIKVLVDFEFEHKCFLINFETLQTILDTVKDFLNDEGVKHAADVLQKVGVTAGTAAAGLFGYLKWRNGRKVESRDRSNQLPRLCGDQGRGRRPHNPNRQRRFPTLAEPCCPRSDR